MNDFKQLLKTLFFLILASSLFISCAEEDDDDDESGKSIPAYTVVTGSVTETDDSVSADSASIIIDESVGSTSSGRNFEFTFSLEDGGSITLYGYTNSGLTSGVETTITRSGSSISLSYTSANGTTTTSSTDLSSLGTGGITLFIDYHNDESPLHAIVWTSSSSFALADAVFDSENQSTLIGNGSGAFWGFQLTNASLSRAIVSSEKSSALTAQ